MKIVGSTAVTLTLGKKRTSSILGNNVSAGVFSYFSKSERAGPIKWYLIKTDLGCH